MDVRQGASRRTLADAHPRADHRRVPHRQAAAPAACWWTTTRTPGAARWPRSIRSRPHPRATVSTPVTWEEVEGGVEIEDFRLDNVPRARPRASATSGSRCSPSARSADVGSSRWSVLMALAALAALPADGGGARRRRSRPGDELAVRAQVGRLPLPRLPRRRRGRAAVEGRHSRSARYFPEVVAALRRCRAPRFVLDGEIVVPVGRRGCPSTSCCMRIHPGREPRREAGARSTRAILVVFDLLVDDEGRVARRAAAGGAPRARSSVRRALLRGGAPIVLLSPATRDVATAPTTGWQRRRRPRRRRSPSALDSAVPLRASGRAC